MTKSTKSWVKPTLNRLGTIADVAGSKKTSGDTGPGLHQNS